MMVSTEELLEELHALRDRVAALEDELSVRRVIAAYGPLVDGGDAEATGRLWAEDAVYDMDVGTLNGRAEITEMVNGPRHRDIIGGGSAHANGPVVVELHGDTAVATGHSQLFRGDGSGGFYVWRIAANRWELARGTGGWQVVRRTTRLLEGRPDARELLRRTGRSDGASSGSGSGSASRRHRPVPTGGRDSVGTADSPFGPS